MNDKGYEVDLTDEHLSACLMCSKGITTNKVMRQGLCLDCMAFIVEHADFSPDDDYPLFIDFAYEAQERLISGESPGSIFKSIPDGFDEWLHENYKKTGFGIIES